MHRRRRGVQAFPSQVEVRGPSFPRTLERRAEKEGLASSSQRVAVTAAEATFEWGWRHNSYSSAPFEHDLLPRLPLFYFWSWSLHFKTQFDSGLFLLSLANLALPFKDRAKKPNANIFLYICQVSCSFQRATSKTICNSLFGQNTQSYYWDKLARALDFEENWTSKYRLYYE